MFPFSPVTPNSDQSFRFVVAPSETTPFTITPDFSRRQIALITSCAITKLKI